MIDFSISHTLVSYAEHAAGSGQSVSIAADWFQVVARTSVDELFQALRAGNAGEADTALRTLNTTNPAMLAV
jgi:hypothetical protein